MRRRFGFVVLATGLGVTALCGAHGRGAFAFAAPLPPVRRAPAIAVPADSGALRLGRAVLLSRRHDLRGVIEQLEPVDFAGGPGFAGADRAAFLLAQAYLQLGEAARFDALADAVGRWPRTSAFTRWLAAERSLVRGETGVSAEDFPETGRLGDSVARGPALEREFANAALVVQATQAIARGAEADSLLARVPADSRYASRALHLRGLLALERGDTAHGTALLDSALADSGYESRREIGLALAGQAMENERWDVAFRRYDAVDRDWAVQHAALEQLRDAASLDGLWPAWAARPDSSGVLAIDAGPTWEKARGMAAEGATSLTEPPAPSLPARGAFGLPDVLRPSPERWTAVVASTRVAESARGALERARWDVAREDEALADRRRYLSLGLDSLGRADARVAPAQSLLDSLRGRIDATERSLRFVRDQEAARVARRTSALLAACEQQSAWVQGMQRIYTAGPDSARYQHSPAGLPTAGSELAAERALAASIRALATHVASAAPGWLARSYEESWSPRLLDRALAQASEIGGQRLFARELGRSLDSSLVDARSSEALAHAREQVAVLARRADSFTAADAALRLAVAREAVTRTLASLEREREGIDYGRAASLYALAVQLGAADSVATAARPAAHDSTVLAAAEQREDAQSAQWRAQALPVLQAFLAQHVGSPARAEMRFRLADLELAQSRQVFREQMAEFVTRQAQGRTAGMSVPVLDPSRALALYRKILAEDPGFEHLDAVRFNAGMILADAGDPESGRFFAELVASSPNSPYAQEAWLRMGDLAFDGKRFPESVERYAHAAAGADPTLAVIANYKLGWAHFNQDHFEPAADAFRAVLDLYGAHRADVRVDIESEADAYLVHAFAGAGGAPAFARYFDRIGSRPYEEHVLLALGQQFRRYNELAQATATDQLVLDRYAGSPEALLAAQRMVETWQRADHPERVREAQLALAERFAPGGAWYARQDSDSLRTAGEAFAHASWLSVAQAHHARARQTGTRDEWQAALQSYETVLEHWPHDVRSGEIRMAAGEACAHLADYPAALRWFGEAAHEGGDSLEAAALVQRVAVTDAWYESTRSGAATGSDSLAHAVLAAGDELLHRFPAHERAADVTWRQSQLAIAHGWNDRAETDLARMASSHASDSRAPLAANQRGEVLFRMQRYDDAGPAFEAALALAQAQGRDSLVRIAHRALPVCAYRAAEAAVVADSNAHAKHAARFEQVATRWPGYELAPLAQYRAGLAYGRARQPREAIRAMQALVQLYPRCSYVNDARLQIARSWEETGDREQAAQAYLDFSRAETDRDNAGAAWLKAAELLAAAGQQPRADALRLEYIRKYPADEEGAMSIMEALARRDLASVGPEHAVSLLIGAPARAHRAAPPASYLADYLQRAAAHPKLASHDVIAQVRFLQGEEAGVPFAALRLTQPLAKSVPAKKTLLDTLLVRYRRAADLGVPVWAHAAAFRIGEALQGFGEALVNSEPPADLKGDDLHAYRSVLAEKAGVFSTRGDDVWSTLLRSMPADSAGDAWVDQARTALHQRLAHRFLFHPEVEFPLVEAKGPARARDIDASAAEPADSTSASPRAARAVARREGTQR